MAYEENAGEKSQVSAFEFPAATTVTTPASSAAANAASYPGSFPLPPRLMLMTAGF